MYMKCNERINFSSSIIVLVYPKYGIMYMYVKMYVVYRSSTRILNIQLNLCLVRSIDSEEEKKEYCREF